MISFIIPAHNVENYISKCIKSIVCMNIEKYEIIIINDGSTDNTKQVIENIALSDNKIKVINLENASGYAGKPRNIGIENSSGEYICFMDPDDYYIGEGIKYSDYKNADITVNSFQIVNHNHEAISLSILQNENYVYDISPLKKFKGIALQRMIFSREIIGVTRFNESLPSQDTLFLFTILKNKPKVLLTNMITTCYVEDRIDSVTNNITEKYINNNILSFELIFHTIDALPIPYYEKEDMKNRFSNWFYKRIKDRLNNEQILKISDSSLSKYIGVICK